MVRIEIKKYIF